VHRVHLMSNAMESAALTVERWNRMQAIFHEAIAVEGAARQALVLRRCAGDTILLSEVETVLRAFDEQKDLSLSPQMERPSGMAGKTIGSWRLDRRLGQGGMGSVYLAYRADGQFEQEA